MSAGHDRGEHMLGELDSSCGQSGGRDGVFIVISSHCVVPNHPQPRAAAIGLIPPPPPPPPPTTPGRPTVIFPPRISGFPEPRSLFVRHNGEEPAPCYVRS